MKRIAAVEREAKRMKELEPRVFAPERHGSVSYS